MPKYERIRNVKDPRPELEPYLRTEVPYEDIGVTFPETALYGLIGDSAAASGTCTAFTYTAQLAWWASLLPTARQRNNNLYVLHVGPPGCSKSHTQRQIALENHVPYCCPSPAKDLRTPTSGDELCSMLASPPSQTTSRLLLLDDVTSLFHEVSEDRSHLSSCITTLYDSTVVGTDRQSASAYLTILGAATFAADESPAELATHINRKTEGMLRRTVIVPYDGIVLAPDSVVGYDGSSLKWEKYADGGRPLLYCEAAGDQLRAWEQRQGKGWYIDLACRIASITSAANQDPHVTEAAMQAAISFAAWQMLVRSVYLPSELAR